MNPLLVTPKWLYEAVINRRVTVFCCTEPQPNCLGENLDSFLQAHIPSARPLVCTADLYPQAPVPPVSEFCKWTGSQGLLSTQSIILYQDTTSSLHIYRVWWQLQYHQIRTVSLLAGNCKDWSMQGLPTEQGAPSKKGTFREANIWADHYMYYSPHDLELFFTGVKATKAYKQKPFVFTQLVYVGTRDEPGIRKLFHHATHRFKDQLMDNKLEKQEALKHKKYIEQRKKNRLLYYSIFDTENLDPHEHSNSCNISALHRLLLAESLTPLCATKIRLPSSTSCHTLAFWIAVVYPSLCHACFLANLQSPLNASILPMTLLLPLLRLVASIVTSR